MLRPCRAVIVIGRPLKLTVRVCDYREMNIALNSLRLKCAMFRMLMATIVVAAQIFAPINAESPINAQTTQVFISDDCKLSFYGNFLSDSEARKRPSYVPWTSSAKPMVFKDPRTAISFYVESDGRHVAAFDSGGALLWVRNPFEEARLCPYRTPRPVIARLEERELSETYSKRIGAKAGHTYLGIQFDSSQFGVLDEADGDFIAEGQN
jgi:hypothetical protein